MWIVTIARKWWTGYLIGALAVACAIAYLRYAKPTPPAYDPTPQPVVTAKEPKVVTQHVTKIITVPGPERIVYLDRQEAAEAVKMPELAISPDNVLAITTIPPHTGPTTAISMLTPTGEGRILYRQEPQKFFQVKKEFRMTARYLFVGRNLAEFDVVANPLRLGPVELQAGVGLEVRRDDSSMGARGWIGAEYRF
jgi:hypothetical protein